MRVAWAHNDTCPWMEKCSYLAAQKATKVWPLAQLTQVHDFSYLGPPGSRLKPLTFDPCRCGHHGKL